MVMVVYRVVLKNSCIFPPYCCPITLAANPNANSPIATFLLEPRRDGTSQSCNI